MTERKHLSMGPMRKMSLSHWTETYAIKYHYPSPSSPPPAHNTEAPGQGISSLNWVTFTLSPSLQVHSSSTIVETELECYFKCEGIYKGII